MRVRGDDDWAAYEPHQLQEMLNERRMQTQSKLLQNLNSAITASGDEHHCESRAKYGNCLLCSIALDNHSDLASLDCGHVFHQTCIERHRNSLTRQTGLVTFECPICHVKSGPPSSLQKLRLQAEPLSQTYKSHQTKLNADLNNMYFQEKMQGLDSIHQTYQSCKAREESQRSYE